MTNSNLKFKTVVSDRPFYNRWHYCIRFYLCEISILRDTLEPADIDRRLDEREQWRQHIHTRFPTLGAVSRHPKIDTMDRQNLKEFAKILRNSDVEYKIVISVDYAWIYSNDLEFINTLNCIDFLSAKKLTEVSVERPKGVLIRKRSRYQYRSYFRHVKITADEKNQLHNFLISQQDIKLSESFRNWFDEKFLRIQDYFFVDYNKESWLTMLSLVRPGLIRKTQPILTK